MKKHNINLDLSSDSTTHGHELCDYSFYYNVSSSSSYDLIINYGKYYIISKDKAIFSTMNECNTKQIFVKDF